LIVISNIKVAVFGVLLVKTIDYFFDKGDFGISYIDNGFKLTK